MKLEWLRADIASARRATGLLAVLLTGSLLVNAVLAVLALRSSGRERIVLVPPAIHKTFWVESDRVSAEYLQQMAYFLMQLTLNVTPHGVDHQADVLMQYAAPSSYGELRSTMAATAARLKRDGASTLFSPRDLVVDEATQRVGVRGQLTTYVSDRRVSDVSKGYAIELQYAGGRIYLKAFRETHPHDPLETQPRSQAAPAKAPGIPDAYGPAGSSGPADAAR
jgi:conjugal transfer pilus assembly protein TraE